MSADKENSYQTAQLSVSMLKDLNLEATIQNIELFMNHINGTCPALSRDLQKFYQIDQAIGQHEADIMYRTHIMRVDLARNVGNLANTLQSEIDDLFHLIEQQGINSLHHSDELGGISNQLRQSAEEFPAVGALLENVVAITRRMQKENQTLESSLAASTNEISSLRRNVETIQKEALSDPLTGISNRKSFDENIDRMITTAGDTNEPLALIMADVDHFKSFNDKWGHQTGDQVLRLVAEVMNANIKGQDLLARYGGEEFAVLLPGTSLENAHMLADRIRRAVESRRLKKRQSSEDLGVITMSMGVAAYRKDDSSNHLIERADKSLYLAKDRGRNCVIDERDIDPNPITKETHVA